MAGLANLSEFFENPLFTETIREVPVETGYIGSRFLPSENTYDMEWNETVIEYGRPGRRWGGTAFNRS